MPGIPLPLQQILAVGVLTHDVDETSTMALEIANAVVGSTDEGAATPRVRYLLCLIVLQQLRITEHIDIAAAGEGVHSVEDLATQTQVCCVRRTESQSCGCGCRGRDMFMYGIEG